MNARARRCPGAAAIEKIDQTMSVPAPALALGLLIARDIAPAHDDAIAVGSNAADGATFTVSLPRNNLRIARQAGNVGPGPRHSEKC